MQKKKKKWSGLPFPPPVDLPESGIEFTSPTLQADSLSLSHQGNPYFYICVLGCIHKLRFLSYQIITSFIIKWWNRMEVIYLDLFSSSVFSACVRWLCCNSLNFWNSQCCFSTIYLQITTFIHISQLCLYLKLIKPE